VPSIGDVGSKGHVKSLTSSYLQALKVLEKSAPKNKFSGRNNEMNFEKFMMRMERAMDAEGVTDELRVEHIDNWLAKGVGSPRIANNRRQWARKGLGTR
jgi:hypothetical protein